MKITNNQKKQGGSVRVDAPVMCRFCDKNMGQFAEACESTGKEIAPGVNESFPICFDCGKQRHAQGRIVVFMT